MPQGDEEPFLWQILELIAEKRRSRAGLASPHCKESMGMTENQTPTALMFLCKECGFRSSGSAP